MRAENEKFIERYHDLLGEWHGQRPDAFRCIFTGRDAHDPDTDLCDAHIIPKRVGEWPGVTVPQRAEVDRYFGRTLDVEFEKMVQCARDGISGSLNSSQQVAVTFKSEGKERIVHGYPQGDVTPEKALKKGKAAIRIRLSDQTVMLAVNGAEEDIQHLEKLPAGQVKINMTPSERSLATGSAALVRAAVLMLFKRSPGTLATNNALEWLVRPFADAFDRELKGGELHKHYAGFLGSVKFTADMQFSKASEMNSLESNLFVVHTPTKRFPESPPFAVSAVLPSPTASGYSLLITLPWSTSPENTETCLDWYRRFQKDPSLPHAKTIVRIDFDSWRVYKSSPDNPDAYQDFSFRVVPETSNSTSHDKHT